MHGRHTQTAKILYKTENSKQIFQEKELRGLSSQFPHSCVCERFLYVYSYDWSAYILLQENMLTPIPVP
jgi:hypothetical protein